MENGHEDNVLLSAFIDGELSGGEKSRVQEHLSECALCREEVQSLRFMKGVLAGSPRRAMPPELISAIEDGVAAPVWRRVFARIPARVFVPAGALAALALIASLWLGVKRESPDQYIPLEPLMTAHARYTAETLVPQGSLVSSTYSAQLTAQNDDVDQQAD